MLLRLVFLAFFGFFGHRGDGPAVGKGRTTRLQQCLGKVVTLRGVATNNPEGAVLIGDGFDIIVEGVGTWPGYADEKEVVVTGKVVLKKYFPDPVIHNGFYVTPGMFGKSYVLEEATWELARPAK